ncbi:MAG: hypothetical protein M2R45_02318 [Verrucomicrobia subdivision 3 bacterium]|nr:hypothetical protein [Limisphaerales bacterium]MCS1414697.1 hypothetical protein [Limisphaerales bacterium]
MDAATLDTSQKAFQLNLDNAVYGTLAEIGAGQEVARWFFRVGGASGSIAKTMSAYDMQFSDAIYGSAKRYVSRERLTTMLNHEFKLLIERLDEKRGATSRFFAFANTVAAKSFRRTSDAHGWMGVRFQHESRAEPSQIIIHTRLLDPENLQQQDALGVVGVNLIFGAAKLFHKPDAFIRSLFDCLTSKRVEIDMIKLIGPAFNGIDNRLMALKLVEFGLTQAAMFTANGEVVQPVEVLYKRPILLERGSFRPPSKMHLDMLECGKAHFIQEPQNEGLEPLVLFEMNMKQLKKTVGVDSHDFLDQADILASLGHPVLISNYFRYYRLANYLFRYTDKMVGLVLGLPNLQELLEEKYYTDLSGGILESFGRMFKNDLKVYVYPSRHRQSGSIISAENLQVASHLRHLYAHLYENHRIQCLRGFNEACLAIDQQAINAGIRADSGDWEDSVPPDIVQHIKAHGSFGFRTESK